MKTNDIMNNFNARAFHMDSFQKIKNNSGAEIIHTIIQKEIAQSTSINTNNLTFTRFWFTFISPYLKRKIMGKITIIDLGDKCLIKYFEQTKKKHKNKNKNKLYKRRKFSVSYIESWE